MKILLFPFFVAFIALASAGVGRQRQKTCQVYVVQYPTKGMRVQQANDGTSEIARSYYSKFSIREYSIHSSNGRPKWSQFHVAIEHKTPSKEYLSNKQAKIIFYNLLFTASLRMGKDTDCKVVGADFSLFGFVELIKTDITWHKAPNKITEYRECRLASGSHYVIKKLDTKSYIFANNTAWSRTILTPQGLPDMVPLKYESSENIVVDFVKHKDTVEYEKLVEKKVFIVQIDQFNEVLDVIAGVDVVMYLDVITQNVTNVPNLDIKVNHSLIKQIANPQKYANVITGLGSKAIRQKPSCVYRLPWSSMSTLNPFPKGMRVYTE